MALVPDMELLESSAVDARTAHTAMAAAAGSGRKQTPAPKLTERTTATTVRIAVPATTISDDPYADLMPDLEGVEPQAAPTRTIPDANLPAAAPVEPPRRPTPAARPTAPPAAATATQAKSATAASSSAPAPQPAAPAKAPAPAAQPRPAAPSPGKKLPNPESVTVPPVMDRDFIARNRIVELYLSGSLPVRGATVFEQFCRENPQILDEIGLPERVHTALRLLDASGKPEPWQEKPKQFWERPYVPAALSALVLLLGIAILMLNRQLGEQTRKATALQQLVLEQPIDAAATTSTVVIQPTHAGPKAAIATVIGGSTAQLVNVRVDMTHSDYRAFRLTIDRPNQGRVEVLNNLIKDSNGQLGFSLNTSVLGADTYIITIEGLDWRGDPQQDSWAAITVRH